MAHIKNWECKESKYGFIIQLAWRIRVKTKIGRIRVSKLIQSDEIFEELFSFSLNMLFESISFIKTWILIIIHNDFDDTEARYNYSFHVTLLKIFRLAISHRSKISSATWNLFKFKSCIPLLNIRLITNFSLKLSLWN